MKKLLVKIAKMRFLLSRVVIYPAKPETPEAEPVFANILCWVSNDASLFFNVPFVPDNANALK